MGVSYWVWTATLVVLTGMLLADLVIIGRRPHEPSLRESTLWVTFYVSAAGLFGLFVWAAYGPVRAGELHSVRRVIDQLVEVDVPPRALRHVTGPGRR